MRSLVLLAPLAALCGCSGVGELDFTSFGRDTWQRPDDVVTVLAVEPGDRVADLGAGEGYFVEYLSAAVGADGRVYAVEVEADLAASLSERFPAGSSNVETILGHYDDPLLPDGELDLVLLVNTYHHIEDRPVYFSKLRSDLRPEGRVSVIDPDLELDGVLALTLDEGHQTAVGDLQGEMRDAGYREVDRFDFLPVQIFAIYASEPAES